MKKNRRGFEQIHDIVYRVAGADMTDQRDCCVYLLDLGEPLLIDCGSGFAFDHIVRNIEDAGFDPATLRNIILTHCHLDHMGSAHLFKAHFGTRLIMHALDAKIVEQGDQLLTAAFCFDTDFQPLLIDTKLTNEQESLNFGRFNLVCVHTPGHTTGSISVYMDTGKERIVFMQDIAAPLLAEFYCDPEAWMRSIKKLLALEADILCDGHTGTYKSKRAIRKYLYRCIASQKKQGYISPHNTTI